MGKKASCCFALVLVSSSPVLAEDNHFDKLEGYAFAASMAYLAASKCPGLSVVTSKLDALRAVAGYVPEDQAVLAHQLRIDTTKESDAFERIGGLAWCGNALKIFGPDGGIIPGLLRE
jgi:hypothetical protein